MAESERNWAEPKWQQYGKHRPPPNIGKKELIERTGQSEGIAYYHRFISLVEQEKMELACIANGIFFREHRHKRMYFMDTRHIIGASDGAETSLLYVEHLSGGEVHGRPITVDELRRKGAKL